MNHSFQVVGSQFRASRFKRSCRDATGQHDEEVHRKAFRGVQNIADAVKAEDTGVFVWVDDDRAGTMRHYRTDEFRRGEHGAFDVKMPVYQTGRQISAFEIDCLSRRVIAEADDPAVFDSDMRFVDFAAEDVNDARVLEQLLDRLFAARYGKFLLNIAH